MNRAMKKRWSTGMLLLLCVMVTLAGCLGGGSEETGLSANGGKSSTGDASNLTPPGTFPIVKEPVELRVLVKGESRIEDFQTNAFTQYYERLTNVKVKFEVAPEGSFQETLNLRLASGDLPDIIMNMGVSRVQEVIFGQQGIFLPLNDLIEKHGSFIKRMFQEKPEYYKAIVSPDGNIYSLPEVNECYHCSLSMKMWIYKPWLDKLGLSMPTTTDEFYKVLKAFKENDPNGNGKADEIPLAGSSAPGAWNASIETFLMNAFVYTPGGVYVKNGKVQVSYDKPEWKAGLEYLHQLYKEGLLAGESFTQDQQQLMRMGENPEAPLLGTFPAGWFGIGSEYRGPSGRWKGYVTVPPLKGPNGVQVAVSSPYQYNSGKLIITNKAKDPAVALRWADGFFNEEVLLRANMGAEGKDWKAAEPGSVGIDGRKAKWEAVSAYGSVTNTQWYQSNPTYISEDYRLSWSAGEKPEENVEVILYNQTKQNYEPYRAPLEHVLPPLFFTEEQSMELADLEKTLNDYVRQMTARFIIGDVDITSEWNNYMSTLKNMNLNRYLAINQEAYDSRKK